LLVDSPDQQTDGTEFSPDDDLSDAGDLHSILAFQLSRRRQCVNQIDWETAANNTGASVLAAEK
jgi:hypothetical protein